MAGLVNHPEMFDLRMSEAARPLYDKVVAFIKEEVERGFNEGANDDEFEMMDRLVDALGPQKTLEELIQGLPSDTVREMLSYIARNYDIPMEMDEETKPHEADRTQGRDVPEDRIRN